MNLYIKKHFLTLKDNKTAVYDQNGAEKFFVHGDFAIAKKYYIDDLNGNELASVIQKKISSTGKCIIYRNGVEIGEIVPKITLIKPKYAVNGLGWIIEGNFKQDEWVIKQNGNVIVSVNVRVFTGENAFEISISDGIDEINALAALLIIEGFFETQIIGTAIYSSVNSTMMS